MITPLMPELPKPHRLYFCGKCGQVSNAERHRRPHGPSCDYLGVIYKTSDQFTDDQLRAYGLAVWKAAMEHAARTCTEWGSARLPARGGDALRNCADAIRSLPLPESDMTQARGE